MPHKIGSQVKILPTYGVDNYGHDIFIPVTNDAVLSAVTIVPSTTTITQSVVDNAIPTDQQDTLLSDVDAIQLLHGGNDAEFNHVYRWHPDMTAAVYKTRILLAIGLNVSVRVSGTITLPEAFVTITEVTGDNNVLFDGVFALSIGALSAVASSYFILDADFNSIFKVFSGNPIDIRIRIPAATESGDSTTQVGILPLFCYQSAAVLKPFTLSGITFHIHASLDHADPIFNLDIERVV